MTIRARRIFRALAHEKRLQILSWLKDPAAHFPPQVDGDLVRDGVCVLRIAEKLGVKQPTATRHLQILADAGLVVDTRIGKWTFFKRNDPVIERLKTEFIEEV
jgi:DNA-binding transcriptional ArsR family regulator